VRTSDDAGEDGRENEVLYEEDAALEAGRHKVAAAESHESVSRITRNRLLDFALPVRMYT
jgi:hypothetical protein